MPIRSEHRHFYPIDWPQLSAVICFGRTGGRCEACGRPHGQVIVCLDEAPGTMPRLVAGALDAVGFCAANPARA